MVNPPRAASVTAVLALLCGAVLVALCATTAAALLRTGSWIDGFITGGVVAAAAVVAALLLLGVPGLLRPGPLLAVHGLEAAVSVLLLARRGRLRIRGPSWRRWSWAPRASWEGALVVLLGLALGWQLLVALVLPPFAYDALAYHLVDVATWVQQGRLVPAPLNPCCAYYPGNAELLSTWSAVLLHSDRLVGTVQIGAAVLCCAAVAGICRTAGLDRRGAAAAGALFGLTPALLAQAPTAYVDVLQTAFVLGGLHGLTRYAAQPGRGRLVVPALCTAILSGTKGNGLLWAAALGLAVVVIGLVHLHRRRTSASEVIRGVAGGLVACVLLGGWWYARSWADTGNPLYPFEVRLGSSVVFPGPLRVDEVLTPAPRGAGRPWPVAVLASWASDLLPWRHGFYDYQQRSGGLGPVWAWLGILTIPMVVQLWRRRSVALVPVAAVVAVFVLQPYPWWARFTLPVAAAGAAAVVVALRWLRPTVLRRSGELAVLLLALLGTLLVVGKVTPASQARPLPAWRVVQLIGAPPSERTVQRLFFPEYGFLDDVPSTATVVVDVGAEDVRFVSPIFGPHFQRTVVAAGSGPVPDTVWVVTSAGRPLDVQLSARRPGPASGERGVRVWAPLR